MHCDRSGCDKLISFDKDTKCCHSESGCICKVCKRLNGMFCSELCYNIAHLIACVQCLSSDIKAKCCCEKCNIDKTSRAFCSPGCYIKFHTNTTIPIKDLMYKVSAGNIEGGFPAQDSGTKWVSHVTLLDDPLKTKKPFYQLLKEVNDNKWPMLENGVEEIDESRHLASYLAIMGYYMAKHDKITIHVHQFPEQCKWLVEQLKSYVKLLCDKFNLDQEKKQISFRTDRPFYTSPETDRKYDCEVLISLSQCVGVGSSVMSAGDMLMADTFIPYEIKTDTMHLSKKYKVKNSLIDDYSDFLNSDYLQYAIENFKEYKSANPNKKHTVPDREEFVFINCTFLHLNGIWEPKGNEVVKIE
jgi:hypothetical protein